MHHKSKTDSLDWSALEPQFQALLEEELTAEGVPGWLQRWSELEDTVQEAEAAADRARSEDTGDQEAEKAFLHFVQEVNPRVQVATQALKTKLLAVSGYRPAPEHALMLKRFRMEADLFRAENVPILAQGQALSNDYNKISGAMTVTLDGREMTLEEAELRLLEPVRARREQAWRAIQTRWLQDRAPLDTLYLNLLSLRRQIARNAGLADFRAYSWQALQRFDYTPEQNLAFHRAVEAGIVPLATRRRAVRARSLGLSSLRPWDIEVDPLARPPLRPFAEVGALEAGAARLFHRVDPALGAAFEQLRSGFLDLGSRRGKAPGGFCSFFPLAGRPYIFMNAVGTQEDVRTLLHEGGHAFNSLLSRRHQPLHWNREPPIEFAEVASMAMELLASPYLEASQGGFYSAEDAARARREHLETIVQFLPYMAVVDAFQHWVYTEAPATVTGADLDACWDELTERFLPGIDWSGLEAERRTGWHRKVHLYITPFYYIEYGLAQLGALQVWRNALADQSGAVHSYKEALSLGGTRSVPELYQAAGARLVLELDGVADLAALLESHLEPAASSR